MYINTNKITKNINFIIITIIISALILSACSDSSTGPESNNNGVLIDTVYYDTIQEAIENAENGDTLYLTEGVYAGDNNKYLSWDGNDKHLVITSFNYPELTEETIIDCGGNGTAFELDYTHQNHSDVIRGITIRNAGGDVWDCGMYLVDVSPRVANVYFENCGWSALYCDDGNPIIDSCRFFFNKVAIFNDYEASTNIRSCWIEDNYESIFSRESASPYIINSLVANNEIGVHCLEDASVNLVNTTIANNDNWGVKILEPKTSSIKNAIIWANETGLNTGTDSLYISHSCLQNYSEWSLIDSLDNIHEDPMFVGGGFYNLRHGSPCIDTGDNSFLENIEYDLDGNPRISNYIVDMGAFELQQGLE
ncbi:MAG: hypothetical protein KGY74_06115 [Candidatus Cloacimonetes bacterium]|nr:hypothetical protein [Candidatus Cloacimonadota bacterium]